ncbi:hypothetical protein BDL97_04G120300 [Sphagnum fallax]|nr:hypothetical protein BDL97_04G120300 [Sphagnum fallax]
MGVGRGVPFALIMKFTGAISLQPQLACGFLRRHFSSRNFVGRVLIGQSCSSSSTTTTTTTSSRMCGGFRPLENLLVMCQAQIAFHGVGFQPQRLLTPSREAFGALYRAKPVNYGLSFFSSSPHTQPFFPLAEISGVMQLMNVFSLFRLADSQRCPSECSQTLSQVKKKKKKKQQPMVAGGELRYLGSVVAPPLPLRRSSRLRSSVSVRFYENANSFGDRTYTTQPSDMSVDAMKIKREFEAFRECFDAIPDTLNRMPKMNPHGVYANHNLRLDRIQVYGFDYDYTLAHYTEELQSLIYKLAKEHLVHEHKYPESCLEFEYDPGFPIRGLFYDKKNGYLLKLDFFHSAEPKGCFFGRRRMSRAELDTAYGGKHISIEHMPNLVSLMDLFCLSEVCLLSDIIQHFVDKKMDFDSSYVYEDIKRSIEFVHQSGKMHDKILAEPSKYLVKNNDVCHMLKSLKESGKKLFILTNSPFPFVDGGMRYLFQDQGNNGEGWKELFDVVVALADKPKFYTSDRPFRYYNVKKDMLTFSRVDSFGPHSVYYHGCLKDFLDITKWQGSEVLYFGDHLYSDLRGPAKAGWGTVAIIRELEREIMTQNEGEYRFEQAKYNIVQELLGRFHGLPGTGATLGDQEKALLLELRTERARSRLAMKALFNPYFGSTFLTDTGKESAFAYNVQRYADVYTSRLENFLQYSTDAWLFTPYDVKILPHHIRVRPFKVLKEEQTQTAED